MSVALPHFNPTMRVTSQPISEKNFTTFLSPISWYGVITATFFAPNLPSAALQASAPVDRLSPQRPASSALNSWLPSQPPKKVSRDIPIIKYCGSAVMTRSTVTKICRRNWARNSNISSSEDSFGASIKMPAAWNPIPAKSLLDLIIVQKSYSTVVLVLGMIKPNFILCCNASGNPLYSGFQQITSGCGVLYAESTSGICIFSPFKDPTIARVLFGPDTPLV
mmetsp:Transcript_10656/g.25334  ORF Transcript_10656/g.25334 Transcript_10656/m.25334 type:complete len:222 (-) Transcript_10656:231-896(-)